jgi:hypothetical protein
MAAKIHEWAVRALHEKGYTQADLTREWGRNEDRDLDDAVVSRWIAIGAPKITFSRILVLSKMLGKSADQVIASIAHAEGVTIVGPKPPAPAHPLPSATQKPADGAAGDLGEALNQAQLAVRRVQELLPNAKVHFSIVLNDGGE